MIDTTKNQHVEIKVTIEFFIQPIKRLFIWPHVYCRQEWKLWCWKTVDFRYYYNGEEISLW